VAVVVVGADRDQRHPGAGGGEEVRVDVGAAVVRHLEDVGAQVDPAVEDPLLRLGTEVSGEQHPDPVHRHAGDDGQVVGRGVRGGDLRRRGEHLQGRGPDPAGPPGDDGLPAGACGGREPVHRPHPVVGRGQRAGRDHVDLPPGQCPGEPAGVVGVEVREEDQAQPVDAEPGQAGVHAADVRAGVDQQPLPRADGDDERITLADVAGHDDGVRRRPAAHRLAQRPTEHHEPDQDGERERAQPAEPPQQDADGDQRERECHRRAGAHRPGGHGIRQRGPSLRDQDQPAHRPAGQPDQDIGRRGGHRRDQGRQQAEHRRRRHRRSGQQVRRQRHQADLAAERRDQRRRRQSCRGAHRQGVGDRRRDAPPAQGPRPRRGEQHDPRRRRDREGEAEIGGQPGPHQQEDEHAGAERRDGRPLPARGECHQRHQAHRRRAQDARPRTGEDHEPDQRQPAHDGLDPTVDRPPPQRPQHAGDRDRHVGAGDGREVREAGPAEVLGEHRIHRAGVAHDQTGQQTARGIREDPRRGVRQPLPEGLRGGLHPAGHARSLRRPAGGQHGDEPCVARQPGGRPHPQRQTGRHVGPPVGGGEQQHVVVQPADRPAVPHGGHRRSDRDPLRACATHRPGQVVEDELDLRGPPPLGDGVQRRGVPCHASQSGRAAGEPERGQHAECDQARPARTAGQRQRERDCAARDGEQQRRGQPGCDQGGQPRDGRCRYQPEVQPRPPAGAHTVTKDLSWS
jgi:hypothetical protein